MTQRSKLELNANINPVESNAGAECPHQHIGECNMPNKIDPLTIAIAQRDRDTIQLVRNALETKNVMLAYQPVVQTKNPDQPAFYEALIRVMDPTGRIIPARDFIDVVETDEIGRIMDCLSLKMGLETLLRHPDIRLSVNMSARSIGYKRWMRTLRQGLRKDPTIAERLILEITEQSAMILPDVVRSFMADLQGRGVAFALDDFGSGYTAFQYLRDFYFDILKIDGQFIRNIKKNPDNQILTSVFVSLAKHFDMFTVAEMVESEQDANFLVDSGIDCMQGYFFGVPTVRPRWMQKDEMVRKSA